ncbi:MAG: hypothetical protein OXQ29_28115 [Rhodospirillaceae bacterium]|nr:hypothetical protein [Rhodospirillaceae bacterium]
MLRRFVPLLGALTLAPQAGAQPADAVVPGEPVRDAIDRFDELNIFSSSRLLSRRMVVQAVPDAEADAVARIDSMLAPYGLVLVMTDEATGYVAQIERPAPGAEPAPAPPPPAAVAITPPPIEEIVVRAPYRLERSLRRTTLNKQQLTQIPALGGDTLRSLQVLPSVSSDGYSARHRIRGGDHNEVLYRLDEVTQFEAFHFSDVQSLFSAVNSNVIEYADVYVSGFPVRYGTRMSGVVDLHLVEPEQPNHGTVDINVLASSADLRGYHGPWSWLLSGRVSVIGEIAGAVHSRSEEDIDTPTFNDQLARLSWNDGRNEFVAGALFSDESLDVERESTGERGQGSYRYAQPWVRWRRSFANGLVMSWQASRFDARRARFGSLERRFDGVGSLTAERTFDIATVRNEWRWPAGEATEWLAGWRLSDHRADYRAAFDVTYGGLGRPVRGRDRESRALSTAHSGSTRHVYVSATTAFGDRLTATAGLRHDGQEIAEVDAGALNGRLALQYTLSGRWSLDLDIGRYTQQQFLHEVQIDEGLTELDSPQHADQVNLGLTWAPRDGLSLRADAFVRRIRDPWTRFDNLYNRLVLLPEIHGDRYLIAADEARARGAEVSVSRTAGDLSLNVSYTYSVAEERIGGAWHPRSWDQPHVVKAGLAWNNRAWRTGAFATYRSGWPVTALVTDPAQLPARLNRERLPGYFSLDANVRRVFRTAQGEFDAYLDVTNLTNRRNVAGYLYRDGLMREDAAALPLVLSLGMTWRWSR